MAKLKFFDKSFVDNKYLIYLCNSKLRNGLLAKVVTFSVWFQSVNLPKAKTCKQTKTVIDNVLFHLIKKRKQKPESKEF